MTPPSWILSITEKNHFFVYDGFIYMKQLIKKRFRKSIDTTGT